MSNNDPRKQQALFGYTDIKFNALHTLAFSLPETLLLWTVQEGLDRLDQEYELYEFLKREGGRWWVRVSMQELLNRFPFWSKKTIERARKALQDRGILLRHDLPDESVPGGVTVWYSIDYDALRKILNSAQANSEE